MTRRKYFVLFAVAMLGAGGNVALSCGMKEIGSISLANWTEIFAALVNPWVVGGIVLLIGFMAAYVTALSWADLTYVLPATAVGYILTAALARFLLYENVTHKRWIGILLITVGVGFVAGTPPLTSTANPPNPDCEIAPLRRRR